MKKILLLTLLVFVACSQDENFSSVKLSAHSCERISPENAIELVYEFMDAMLTATRSADSRKIAGFGVIHSQNSTTTRSGMPADTLLYLLNFENEQGYAVVSPDPRIGILALTDDGSLRLEDFNSTGTRTRYSENEGIESEEDQAEFIAALLLAAPANYEYVESPGFPPMRPDEFYGPHLGKMKWHQRSPFNNVTSSIIRRNQVAGCGPLAVAALCANEGYPTTYTYLDGRQYNLIWELERHIGAFGVEGIYNPGDTYSINRLSQFIFYLGHRMGAEYPNVNLTSIPLSYNYGTMLQALGFKNISFRSFSSQYRTSVAYGYTPIITADSRKGGHAWLIDGYYPLRLGITWPGTLYHYCHCWFGWQGKHDGWYNEGVFTIYSGLVHTDRTIGDYTQVDDLENLNFTNLWMTTYTR